MLNFFNKSDLQIKRQNGIKMDIKKNNRISIIGAGNLGQAIAKGLVKSGSFTPDNIILTRRALSELTYLGENSFGITDDNSSAVIKSDLIIVSVGPQDAERVLNSFKDDLGSDKHTLISTMTGVSIKKFKLWSVNKYLL